MSVESNQFVLYKSYTLTLVVTKTGSKKIGQKSININIVETSQPKLIIHIQSYLFERRVFIDESVKATFSFDTSSSGPLVKPEKLTYITDIIYNSEAVGHVIMNTAEFEFKIWDYI